MHKLLTALLAGFFAAGAFAQATPVAPAHPARAAVQAEPKAEAKGDKKAAVQAGKKEKVAKTNRKPRSKKAAPSKDETAKVLEQKKS